MSYARLNRVLTVSASLLFLPGRIIEEGLHVIGAFAFAREISVHINPESGSAHTRVNFRSGTPRWAIRLAYALPEIVAAVAGIAVISYWFIGGRVWLPSTSLDWVLLSLFGAQWLAIALPSAADLDQQPEGEQ